MLGLGNHVNAEAEEQQDRKVDTEVPSSEPRRKRVIEELAKGGEEAMDDGCVWLEHLKSERPVGCLVKMASQLSACRDLGVA